MSLPVVKHISYTKLAITPKAVLSFIIRTSQFRFADGRLPIVFVAEFWTLSSQVKNPQRFGGYIFLRFQVEWGKGRNHPGGTNIKNQSHFLDSFQNFVHDNGHLPSSGSFRVGLSILLWVYREIFVIPSRQMLEFCLKIITSVQSQHSQNIISLLYIISALETFFVKYITNRVLCS